MTGQLDKLVLDRLGEENKDLFSPEALAALRLCELFDSVRPQEYVLPLDALAGFPQSGCSKLPNRISKHHD